MSNPLLETGDLPAFSRIRPEHAEPAIRQLIDRNKKAIDGLLTTLAEPGWDKLVQVIEDLDDELSRAWSPVSHLNSVQNSDELREAYNRCLPMLSEYSTWMGQHAGLHKAYQAIADSPEFTEMDAARQSAIDHALRDFRLAGVALAPEDQEQYATCKQRLSELSSKFGENVLDATNAWSKDLTAEDLGGLPESALSSARQLAEQAGEEGYKVNLEFPSFNAVMTWCDNRELRQEMYTAYTTRASDQGPHAGQWNNEAIIVEILELRGQLAHLLGFENYAELSLATKMAESPDQVTDFLEQLASHSLGQARSEWSDLRKFAREAHGIEDLQTWDTNYYSEKLRQNRYRISQEEIRPYLPVDQVLPGLFEVVRRLYDIEVRELADFDSYHEDVRLFEIRRKGETIARFFLDLYARAKKQGGAWMGSLQTRRQQGESLLLPVAYLVCNFTPPVGEKPALLTHNELLTLFHEFGHGLHHMLTRQTVAAVSGINGVAWDAVELPSQFLENWCWEKEALAFISGHFETGEPLPDELLEKLLAARDFQAAMMMVRQLEFSLFDFQLHRDWGSDRITSVQGLLDEIREHVAVTRPPEFNRFQNSFSHIFSGGYAAGYYSYKWAEVLSADAFSRFEEDGIFNRETGNEFLHHILEAGGSRDAMDLFVAFRGREPEIEALLRHNGIR